MRRLILLAALLLTASPALAVNRFVLNTTDPLSGTTYCDGTFSQTLAQAQANQDCSGPQGITGQCQCAYSQISACASGTLTQSAIGPGDTCSVGPGKYTIGNNIIPASGTGTAASQMVKFVCPTDQVNNFQSTEANRCIIKTGSGGVIADLRGKSYVEFDGFTVEPLDSGTNAELILWGVGQSGTVDCDPTGGITNCSQGVIWNHLKVRDLAGSPAPFLRVRSWGGGRLVGNTLKDSYLFSPTWGSSGIGGGIFFATGYSVGTTAAQETNTQILRTFISGGRNALTITDSKDLLLDGVRVWGAKNHMTDWCNSSVFTGSTPGCENITIRNSVFGPAAEFREPVPQVLGRILNLTIENSVISGGWQMPFNSHDCDLTGTFTLRNSVIVNLDSNGANYSGEVNGGCTGSGCAQTCSDPITYVVDYNAYLFTPLTVVQNQWRDSRNKTCTGSPSSPVCTNSGTWAGTNIAGWRAASGLDTHSVSYITKDWNGSYTTTGGVTASYVFGNSAPLWGTQDQANFNGTGFANVNTRKFSSNADWTGDLASQGVGTGVFFEYDLDGTLRMMTAATSTTTNTNLACDTNGDGSINSNDFCDNDITFQPNIDRDADGTFDSAVTNVIYADKPTGERWAWIYGYQRDANADGTNDFTSGQSMPFQTYHTWALNTGSPLIDIGDPLSCGHTALDGDGTGGIRCDIGPVEYDGAPPPVGSLNIVTQDLAISEAAGTVAFTVTQDNSSLSATTCNWATSAGTATAGGACAGTVDYVTASGTITFSSGGSGPKSTTTGNITICNDAFFELPETLNVTISGCANATDTVVIQDAIGVGTIGSDDAAPTISFNSPSGAESSTPQTFTGTLSAAAGTAITLDYATASASATSGSDFTATSGTLTWAAGATTAQFTVAITDDAFVENTEVYVVNFTNATPAAILVPLAGSGTITDNDSASGATTLRGVTIRGAKVNLGQPGAAVLALGTITGATGLLAAGHASCVASTSYPCALATVTGCANVAEDRQVRLYIGQKAAAATALGTVILIGGGRSTALWENSLAPNNANAITTLRNAGYRVIQAVWDPPGWNSDLSNTNYGTNEKYMACRTATIIDYIHDNFLPAGSPLCAIGNSSGSESIAYAMAYYQSYTQLDAVYLGAGPYGTRLDLGCLQAPLTGGGTCESVYGLPETANAGKALLSEGMGGADTDGDGTDDCTEADTEGLTAGNTTLWQQASLAYATATCPDTGTFYYPNTHVSMRVGSLDSTCTCTAGNCTNAPNHADLYHDELDNTVAGRGGATTCHATQTLLDQSTVSGPGHTIHANSAGVTDWSSWVYTGGAPNKCVVYP